VALLNCLELLCFIELLLYNISTCLWQIKYRRLLAFIFVELILKRQTRFVHQLTVLLHDLYQVGVLVCKLRILGPDSISKEFFASSV